MCIFLVGCSTRPVYAPVSEVGVIEPIPKNGMYQVRSSHDTIYAIAWRYGLDYRSVVKRNHLTRPYHLKKRQVLYLSRDLIAGSSISHRNSIARMPRDSIAGMSRDSIAGTHWIWPAKGVVTRSSKGINIAGHYGDPIFASQAGKVVYSGDGLRSYGNLIIIKHNTLYLTAYAYNRVTLVKEGEVVKAGQKIAEMGKRGLLHFEMRLSGRPINPLQYL